MHNSLKELIQDASKLQAQDNQRGIGPSLPHMLGKKYPNAYRQPAWMFIFPSTTICQHPITGKACRHHLHDSVPRKALKKAVTAAGLNTKKISDKLRPVIHPSGQPSVFQIISRIICVILFATALRLSYYVRVGIYVQYKSS